MADKILPRFIVHRELQLKHTGATAGEVNGWLVEGRCARQWLDELDAMHLIGLDLQLIPIPRSISDLSPVGLLAIPKAMSGLGIQGVCIGYREINVGSNSRLFVPVGSCLEPVCNPVELARLLPDSNICVWHPRCGLIACDPSQVWGTSDLLAAPPRDASRWMVPPQVESFPNDIARLSAPIVTELSDFLPSASDGIGKFDSDLNELPPAEGEPTSSVGKASSHFRRQLAKFLLSMTGRVSASADSDTWVNKVEQWAGNQLQRTASAVLSNQQRELNRLVQMLNNDPDRGLEYALPLSGTHRCREPSNGRLGRNNVDFSMGLLRGGRAAAGWDMDATMWLQLRQKYLELAKREEDLGRYRRAAYIYAHLIVDLHSAAKTLEKGRLWQEAAVIYRDRLTRPLDAARCFANAERYEDAIELLAPEGKYLEAGDLLRSVGQEEHARRCFRQAIQQHVSRFEVVAAADIQKSRLNEEEEAIRMLCANWPQGRQAIECAETAFRWYGEAGRDEEALAMLQRLQAVETTGFQMAAASVQQTVTLSYPNKEVVRQAADGARLSVAKVLESCSQRDASRMGKLLSSLEANDRMLARDAKRYVDDNFDVVELAPARVHQDYQIEPLHTFSFAKDGGRVLAVVADKDHVYAALHDANHILFQRLDWQGNIELPIGEPWGVAADETQSARMRFLDSDRKEIMALAKCKPEVSTPIRFGKASHEWTQAVIRRSDVYVEKYFNREPFSFDFDGDSLYLLRNSTTLPLIAKYDVSMRRIAEWPLESGEDNEDLNPSGWTIRIDRNHIVAVAARSLYRLPVDLNSEPVVARLPGLATSMDLSLQGTIRRAAVGYRFGVCCAWLTNDLQASHDEFPDESPLVCFLPSGQIVAAGETTVRVYSSQHGVLRREGEWTTSKSTTEAQLPIAVVPGPQPLTCGIVYETGNVLVLKLQPMSKRSR